MMNPGDCIPATLIKPFTVLAYPIIKSSEVEAALKPENVVITSPILGKLGNIRQIVCVYISSNPSYVVERSSLSSNSAH